MAYGRTCNYYPIFCQIQVSPIPSLSLSLSPFSLSLSIYLSLSLSLRLTLSLYVSLSVYLPAVVASYTGEAWRENIPHKLSWAEREIFSGVDKGWLENIGIYLLFFQWRGGDFPSVSPLLRIGQQYCMHRVSASLNSYFGKDKGLFLRIAENFSFFKKCSLILPQAPLLYVLRMLAYGE